MDRLGGFEVFLQVLAQFTPVWISLAIIFALIYIFKDRLGLLGKLTYSPIGMVGLFLVLFWVLTAIFADWIAPFDWSNQLSGMKNRKPGWPVTGQERARLSPPRR